MIAPPVHAPGFRSRRALNWLIAGAMYAFFYMARYNFAAISGKLAEIFGWTNTDVGWFSSIGALVYGLSVFLNGPLADRIGGRKSILIGAGGAAVLNFVFGFGHLLVDQPALWAGEGKERHVVTPAVLHAGLTHGSAIGILLVVWAANFYFQSYGALSIVKINAAWFHVRERGTFAGIFGILIRLGLLLAFEGTPRIIHVLPWQWAFWIPAAALAVFFVLGFLFVRNTPRDAGLGEYLTGDEAPGGSDAPAKLAVVLKKVFANPTMWTIALGSMMIGFVRRSAVDDWWSKYFVNVHHAPASALSSFPPYLVAARGIAIAGIVGGIVFGVASDRVFGGRRAPVVVFGFLGQAAILAIFGLSDHAGAGPMASAWSLVALSFMVNGAHGMVGGAASMDFGGKKAAATAAGLFDGMQYLAGAFVGVGVGYLVDHYGWGVWPFAPIPFALFGAVLMSRLWNVLPGSSHGAPAKAAASRAKPADAAGATEGSEAAPG